MIRIDQILTPARSCVNVPGGSKKRVLEYIAQLFARDVPALDADTLFDSLIAREKLGSTGFGNGIAIPHCRIAGCDSPLAAILNLDAPVDFDAIDGAPVDLLFVLLVPPEGTEEHLSLLRQIAALLDQPALRERLRQAADSDSLFQLITQPARADGAG